MRRWAVLPWGGTTSSTTGRADLAKNALKNGLPCPPLRCSGARQNVRQNDDREVATRLQNLLFQGLSFLEVRLRSDYLLFADNSLREFFALRAENFLP